MLAQFPGHQLHQQASLPCASRRVRIGRPSSSNGSTAVAVQRRSSNVVDYATGLGSLVQANRISEAVSLLDKWLDEQRRPHGLSTGDLLEALCNEGRHDTSWRLIRRLSATNNRLSLKVLHRLLKLAGQHGTVDDVLAVYQHQQQLYGFASTAVQTTLIHALLKADSKGRAGNLLAYEAWGRLSSSGRQLDAQALLAGMHACVCVGRLAEAEALLEPVREAAGAVGRPMVSAFNLLMKAHAKAADTQSARKVFATMKARRLTPDAVTYNTLLSSFVAAGEVVRARAVLDKMRREGVPPDAWTYTTLVLGLGQQGQLQEMQDMFQEMYAEGIQPNSATYAAMIDAYANAGDMEAAHATMQCLYDQQQQQPLRQQQQQLEKWLLQHQRELEQQWWQTEQDEMQQQQQQASPIPPQLLLLQQQSQQLQARATNSSSCTSSTAVEAQQVVEPASKQVLRHMYNTLIKGHLQLAAAAVGSIPNSSSSSIAVSSAMSPLASGDDCTGRMRDEFADASAATAAGFGSTSSTRMFADPSPFTAALPRATSGTAAGIPLVQQQSKNTDRQMAQDRHQAAPQQEIVQGVQQQAEAAAAPSPAATANRPLWNPKAPPAAATNNSPQLALQPPTAAAAAAAAVSSPMLGYQSALGVLGDMSSAGVAPGVDTYTLLINHLIKANDPAGLQLLLESVAAAGLQPDQVLLTSLLKAAGQAGNYDAACEIFDMLILATQPQSTSSSSSSSSGIGEGSQQQEKQQQQQQLERLVVQLSSSSSSSSGGGSNNGSDASSTSVSSSSSINTSLLSSNKQDQVQQRHRPGQQQHLRVRRGKQQQLLPLTTSSGPDAVAWNALVAVLVQAGRLGDAAAAVERAVQAAVAVGQTSPPIEGFAALIRGYRNVGTKHQAVAALRRFLSLGGRPVRVMCNDVITLCLRDDDLRTARQVVRAMELTGCVSDADIASYHAWFERWQARSVAAAAASAGMSPVGTPGGSRGSVQASAVERLKWWLGLPNSYYEGGKSCKQRR